MTSAVEWRSKLHEFSGFSVYILQSTIVGKRLREMPPAGRAKLRRAIRVPIFSNCAPLSIFLMQGDQAKHSADVP